MRADQKIIYDWMPTQSRVLDLGCGDGHFLKILRENRQVHGWGIEIDDANVVRCIEHGVNVLQSDLEQGLQGFGNHYFDVAILSQTIQAIHGTEKILQEMLRVARQAVVTLPNFGYWKQRWQLMLGRMPVSESLPYQWYNSPNVRFCTLKDFSVLCANMGITVLDYQVLDDAGNIVKYMPNTLGAVGVYRLGRD